MEANADNMGITYDSNVEWHMFVFCENWLGWKLWSQCRWYSVA